MFLKENDIESYVEPVKPVQTPWDTFRKAADSENYHFIRKVCSESTEGSLRTYRFIESQYQPETTNEMEEVGW